MNCDLGLVVVDDEDGAEPSSYDFIDCELEPSDFDSNSPRPSSVFRVQRADGSAYRLEGDGTVEEIAPFYESD